MIKCLVYIMTASYALASLPCVVVETTAPENKELRVVYRLPKETPAPAQVMILFGGRNWSGEHTIEQMGFKDWADEHGVLLISPSYKNDDYWEPEKWSGKALKDAIKQICNKHGVTEKALLMYGYSAGGQCAALFYAYMPEQVQAWGAHGCGVYPREVRASKAPAVITCGKNDEVRWEISRYFAQRYRERGGRMLWLDAESGHELSDWVTELAQEFFTAILSKHPAKFVGDDDSGIIYPIEQADRIHEEYRSYLWGSRVCEVWKKKAGVNHSPPGGSWQQKG